jgi:hypothetical protein
VVALDNPHVSGGPETQGIHRRGCIREADPPRGLYPFASLQVMRCPEVGPFFDLHGALRLT